MKEFGGLNMIENTKEFLKKYNINESVLNLYETAMNDIQEQFKKLDDIREYNQLKVLHAFQEEHISESHFTNTTGYGYGDIGRDSLDKVYARIFNTESRSEERRVGKECRSRWSPYH